MAERTQPWRFKIGATLLPSIVSSLLRPLFLILTEARSTFLFGASSIGAVCDMSFHRILSRLVPSRAIGPLPSAIFSVFHRSFCAVFFETVEPSYNRFAVRLVHVSLTPG